MSHITGNSVEKTNFSANGQTLVLNVAGLNSVRFEFSGTYSFTATFESSNNSTNGTDGVWFGLNAAQVDASTISLSHSTANATRAYEASCHNDQWIRVRLTAFTSAGTHRVAIAGSVAALEPAPAIVLGSGSASIGQVSVSSLPAGTAFNLTSAASTNATSVKTSAGNLFEVTIDNVSAADRFVKFYNKASAPTVGTDVPVWIIRVQPTSSLCFNFGAQGKRFATGLAYAITTNIAVTDTTAIAAGDVHVHGTYV